MREICDWSSIVNFVVLSGAQTTTDDFIELWRNDTGGQHKRRRDDNDYSEGKVF